MPRAATSSPSVFACEVCGIGHGRTVLMRQFLDLDRRFVIAHRGGAKCRPENTMAAFDYAVELGVDAIEVDVHLSRDEHAVVIHDPTLNRTTSSFGAVADRSADELARLKVPALRSVLLRHQTMPFMIELKPGSPAMVRAAIRAVADAGAVDRVLFGSFSLPALALVREHGGFITSAATPEVTSAVIRSRFFVRPTRRRAYQLLQVPELTKKGTRIVSPRFIRLARAAGMPVHVWVVDEPADVRRLLGWGVTGFITDQPDVVKATLAAAGG
ncbi:MAG: hypothetical protein EPO35_12790 [Acidobacteria bacterium]|nr:MAG: hypothetical protein EPO35_12790 [Acidobacteriota bacterium]